MIRQVLVTDVSGLPALWVETDEEGNRTLNDSSTSIHLSADDDVEAEKKAWLKLWGAEEFAEELLNGI